MSLDILPPSALRLVGLGRVQDEIPDELAVFSEHPYVKISDQDQYATEASSSEPEEWKPVDRHRAEPTWERQRKADRSLAVS